MEETNRPYVVCHEKRGRPKAHVIEALTGQVSNEYLNDLRKVDASYVFAGEEHLDCGQLR